MPEMQEDQSAQNISAWLMALLACPACQSSLVYSKNIFLCESCQKQYPLLGVIPVLMAK